MFFLLSHWLMVFRNFRAKLVHLSVKCKPRLHTAFYRPLATTLLFPKKHQKSTIAAFSAGTESSLAKHQKNTIAGFHQHKVL